MASEKWESESWTMQDERADEHIIIKYGWDEDWGYWIKVMDDRLEMADDWRCPYNTLAELDRFRASVLDGGYEGCYLSAYTGPRGRGKKVDFEVMLDLWEIYKVPRENRITYQFRNMSDREIQEVSDTVDAKNADEWENPWALERRFDSLNDNPLRGPTEKEDIEESEESEESKERGGNGENDEDEDA